MLMDMGFIRSDVLMALDACYGDTETALDYLLAVVCRDEASEPPFSAAAPSAQSYPSRVISPSDFSTAPPPLLADDVLPLPTDGLAGSGFDAVDYGDLGDLGLGVDNPSIPASGTVNSPTGRGGGDQPRRHGRGGGRGYSSSRPTAGSPSSQVPAHTITARVEVVLYDMRFVLTPPWLASTLFAAGLHHPSGRHPLSTFCRSDPSNHRCSYCAGAYNG